VVVAGRLLITLHHQLVIQSNTREAILLTTHHHPIQMRHIMHRTGRPRRAIHLRVFLLTALICGAARFRYTIIINLIQDITSIHHGPMTMLHRPRHPKVIHRRRLLLRRGATKVISPSQRRALPTTARSSNPRQTLKAVTLVQPLLCHLRRTRLRRHQHLVTRDITRIIRDMALLPPREDAMRVTHLRPAQLPATDRLLQAHPNLHIHILLHRHTQVTMRMVHQATLPLGHIRHHQAPTARRTPGMDTLSLRQWTLGALYQLLGIRHPLARRVGLLKPAHRAAVCLPV
jgi:hypothetical protein